MSHHRRSMLVLLFALSLAQLVRGQQVKWETVCEMDGQLFPLYLIATANREPSVEGMQQLEAKGYLGDPNGQLGIKVTSSKPDVSIRLRIEGDEVIQLADGAFKLEKAGQAYRVFPKIAYRYLALAANRQPRPVSLIFKLTVDGHEEDSRVVNVRLRSINDCPLSAPNNCNEDIVDLTYVIASYVDEDHPWVDQLLKEALATGLVNSFTGYQSSEDGAVERQIFAVWNVLQRHGIKYSSITNVAPTNERVRSQHIRFFEDSIKSGQANCVDGTILFASVLKKIGLHPSLVIIPGHMFLLVDQDERNKDKVYAIETTLLGATDLKPLPERDVITELLRLRDKNSQSALSFSAAIKTGSEEFEKAKSLTPSGGPNRKTWMFSIAAVRAGGINTIPYVPEK